MGLIENILLFIVFVCVYMIGYRIGYKSAVDKCIDILDTTLKEHRREYK